MLHHAHSGSSHMLHHALSGSSHMLHHAHSGSSHMLHHAHSGSSHMLHHALSGSSHMLHHAHNGSSGSKRMTPVQREVADAARRRYFAASQPPPRASMRANSPLRAVSNSTYALSSTTLPHNYASDTFWSEPMPDAPPYRRLVERLLAPLGRMPHRA
jgi:hypothetical protein